MSRDERAQNAKMSASEYEGVAVIKPRQMYVGQQGFGETVGARNVLLMPRGGVAKARYHKGIETIAYML